jgi:hypothetical protein
MSYLFFCALVSLIFGLLFLVSPDVLGTMGSVFNAGLFTLDSSIMRYRLWLGALLLAIAAWIFYVGLQVSSWYIVASWMIALAFGLLFLLLPGWLAWLSKASNSMLVSTDEMILGWRRVIGIALIVSGIYIFYGIFLSMK